MGTKDTKKRVCPSNTGAQYEISVQMPDISASSNISNISSGIFLEILNIE